MNYCRLAAEYLNTARTIKRRINQLKNQFPPEDNTTPRLIGARISTLQAEYSDLLHYAEILKEYGDLFG